MASPSCGVHDREHCINVRNVLAVLKPVGEHVEGQRLCATNRVKTRIAVHHHAGEIRDLGDPASIGFLFDFNAVHDGILARARSRTAWSPPRQHRRASQSCDDDHHHFRGAVDEFRRHPCLKRDRGERGGEQPHRPFAQAQAV